MYKVVDREGVECLVTFNIADRSQFPRIYAECKDGYTMCIMYATYHHFADGQNGIRVEVANTVKVLGARASQCYAYVFTLNNRLFRAAFKNSLR
jgi:uncharacterized lipoprotein NlpE involved in copper resistance